MDATVKFLKVLAVAFAIAAIPLSAQEQPPYKNKNLAIEDRVADLYMPADDFGFRRTFADIGKFENVFSHGQPSIARFIAAITRGGPGKYCHSKAWG